jgi:hypothetical protein
VYNQPYLLQKLPMKKLLLLVGLFVFSTTAMPQKMDSTQTAVKKVYVDFVKWYRNNAEKLDGYELAKGSSVNENGQQPPWIMNWKNVEKYFANIRKKVPWLGETFIANERKFLKTCEKYWKEDPTEEITVGFDFDRFIGGQESPPIIIDNYILAKHVKWKVEIKGDNATIYYAGKFDKDDNDKPVKIKDGTKVKMKKEKGVWKIALLQNHFHYDK